MVWTEYVEETNDPREEYYGDYESDHEDDNVPHNLGHEDWVEWYSRDLLNMWFSLCQYREDASVSNFILNFATYSDFCEFCYRYSSGTRNSYPS
jgi:hypothetical protein